MLRAFSISRGMKRPLGGAGNVLASLNVNILTSVERVFFAFTTRMFYNSIELAEYDWGDQMTRDPHYLGRMSLENVRYTVWDVQSRPITQPDERGFVLMEGEEVVLRVAWKEADETNRVVSFEFLREVGRRLCGRGLSGKPISATRAARILSHALGLYYGLGTVDRRQMTEKLGTLIVAG